MSMLYGGTRARRRPIAPCNVRMRRSATSDLSSTRPRRPRLPGGRGRGARQTSGVRAGRGGRTSPAAAPGTAHQTFDARALRQGTSPGHFARGHLLRFRSPVGASGSRRRPPLPGADNFGSRCPGSAGQPTGAKHTQHRARPQGARCAATCATRVCRSRVQEPCAGASASSESASDPPA
jgi:hypothetical protein